MDKTATTLSSRVWVGFIVAAMLIPQQFALAFQQGSPNPTRESSGRSSLDIERLAEEHYRLGLAYMSVQSTEKAVEQLEKAVSLVSGNAEFHFRLAEAYARDFSYANILRKPFIAAKMKTQLELAVRHNPSSVEFREALIQYYVLAPTVLGGSYDRAKEQAAALVRIDPYFSLLAYANIFSEEGDHEKANNYYLRAIQTRPNFWQGYQRYGNYCLSVRETDKAIQYFLKYVELAPESAASYEHLAGAYVRKRSYDAAIAAYLKAVEKDPSLTQLVFRIAQLYEFKDSPAEAVQYYAEYLKRSPNGRLAEDARTKLSELK